MLYNRELCFNGCDYLLSAWPKQKRKKKVPIYGGLLNTFARDNHSQTMLGTDLIHISLMGN